VKGYTWVFALAGLLLGVLFAYQFRFTAEIDQAEARAKVIEISGQINQIQKEHESLQSLIVTLRNDLDNATPLTPALRDELEIAKVEAGVSELSGPGIEVTLNDSTALRPGSNPNFSLLHDDDVLAVLNELKAAGAEAISINDQRLLATTEVRCAGPTILLNKTKRLTPPYVIQAIGNPEIMESSLKMPGGVVQTLQIFGIHVSIKRVTQIVVPAYSGVVTLEYAGTVD
jgi:uncharacterized protein YlxW (UPF0749 family)